MEEKVQCRAGGIDEKGVKGTIYLQPHLHGGDISRRDAISARTDRITGHRWARCSSTSGCDTSSRCCRLSTGDCSRDRQRRSHSDCRHGTSRASHRACGASGPTWRGTGCSWPTPAGTWRPCARVCGSWLGCPIIHGFAAYKRVTARFCRMSLFAPRLLLAHDRNWPALILAKAVAKGIRETMAGAVCGRVFTDNACIRISFAKHKSCLDPQHLPPASILW